MACCRHMIAWHHYLACMWQQSTTQVKGSHPLLSTAFPVMTLWVHRHCPVVFSPGKLAAFWDLNINLRFEFNTSFNITSLLCSYRWLYKYDTWCLLHIPGKCLSCCDQCHCHGWWHIHCSCHCLTRWERTARRAEQAWKSSSDRSSKLVCNCTLAHVFRPYLQGWSPMLDVSYDGCVDWDQPSWGSTHYS